MPAIYDQNGSVIRELHYENEDLSGQVTMVTRQDADALLRAAALQREIEERKPKSADGLRNMAKIPLTVVEQAMREGWIHDKAKWRAWLNDPDNARLRVTGGRV